MNKGITRAMLYTLARELYFQQGMTEEQYDYFCKEFFRIRDEYWPNTPMGPYAIDKVCRMILDRIEREVVA